MNAQPGAYPAACGCGFRRAHPGRRLRGSLPACGLLAASLALAACASGARPSAAAKAVAAPAAPAPSPREIRDDAAFLRSLPAAAAPAFTEAEAMALVAMPLACLDHPQANPTENPFSTQGYLYVYDSKPRLVDAYDKHRAFYGCYDWHSAVNSTWTMVEVLKRFPGIPVGNLIREKLDQHLGKSNLEGELAFFKKAQRFEQPFGQSWLLKLDGELLRWNDPQARKWAANVAPLARYFSAGLVKYLDELPDATRIGEHPNTAYSMSMMLDYASAASDAPLRRAVFATATRFYVNDTDCPTAYEPAGASFLSPCLEEAKLMSRVFDRARFASWFDNFMPAVYSPKFRPLVHPFDTSGITDPKLLAGKSHLIGLGLFRGEAMLRIAEALPASDPRVPVYRRLAAINAEKSFQGFEGAGYLGSHWMGTYAVLYELAASSAPGSSTSRVKGP
ncbi:MAG TPA: DUF2891 family protein [Candidatus Acidoferrales bacterium]|nr:DUF2891 family protein [Candidatus Acidoferrales bacterium]